MPTTPTSILREVTQKSEVTSKITVATKTSHKHIINSHIERQTKKKIMLNDYEVLMANVNCINA